MPKVVSNVLHRFETWSLPEGVIFPEGVRDKVLRKILVSKVHGVMGDWRKLLERNWKICGAHQTSG